MFDALSQGGALASYGFSSGDTSIQTDLRPLLRKAVRLSAFYQARPQYDVQMPTLLREAAEFIRSGKPTLPVAVVYPMTQIIRAVEHALRGGKVLLDFRSEE